MRLPEPIRKREILYSEHTPREELIRMGRAYRERELFADALDFFLQARSREDLQLMKEHAFQTADAFILARMAKVLPELVTEGDWDRLAQEAARQGRLYDAERARARGGAVIEPQEKQEEKKK